MNDPVFLDSAAFLRVWQRVTGEAGITTAPEQPETDPLTAQLRECICAKAAGAAFYAALAQRVCAVRQPLGQIAAQKRAQLRALQTEYFLRTGALCALPAACPRLSTAAADLRCISWQELALSARTDFLREMRAKCESFKLALDFTGNFDYNVQADNLK